MAKVSYFETSANKLLTPVEALQEAREALDAFGSEPEQTWQAVPYALKRVSYAISASSLNRQLLAIEAVKQFVSRVDNFFQGFTVSASGKKDYVKKNISELEPELDEILKRLTKFYPQALMDKVLSSLSRERSVESNRC